MHGVVQTVAFSSYINIEKHEAYTGAVSKIIQTLAQEREFKIISRSEIRKLEASERKSYLKNYKTLSKEASSLLTKTDPKPVDVSDYVDHIDYLVEKIGLDHVGISSDFDGGGGVYGWV